MAKSLSTQRELRCASFVRWQVDDQTDVCCGQGAIASIGPLSSIGKSELYAEIWRNPCSRRSCSRPGPDRVSPAVLRPESTSRARISIDRGEFSMVHHQVGPTSISEICFM